MTQKPLFTRNFSLLLLGQASSLFGNTILRFALAMYVLETTGSASIFATLLAISTLPTIVLSPFGGLLADRINKRNIMVLLDFLSGITILAVLLFFSGGPSIAGIGFVLCALSVLGAFESPTVQACVPQMHTGDNVVRANAAVNQIAAVAGLLAPILGSVLYTMFGVHRVMQVTMVCFFVTALLECFIQLDTIKQLPSQGVIKTMRADFSTSFRFLVREQPAILKILFLAAAINFLLMGIVVVGMPFIIRTVLGLDAKFYGAAESIMGMAAIAGSISVSFFVTKLKTLHLYRVVMVLGLAIFPAGICFLLSAGIMATYYVLILSAFVLQFSACVLSIFILSIIQQNTPAHLIGKIMAYVVTISMCAQPLGQLAYGLLFDRFSRAIYLILLATAAATCAIGFATKPTFQHLDRAQDEKKRSQIFVSE